MRLIPNARHSLTTPVWLPPLASVVVLFVLFVVATLVRRSSLADAGRPVMIALSAAAAVIITLHGARMMAAARARGWPSALAGTVMVVLGIYTLLHVLR